MNAAAATVDWPPIAMLSAPNALAPLTMLEPIATEFAPVALDALPVELLLKYLVPRLSIFDNAVPTLLNVPLESIKLGAVHAAVVEL
ncbi:hypothetical protein GCM10009103_54840 [Pseudomonas koreensis]|nr:hypothetical protein GCM10009103_54840 [Pseudomonas koreensis]